MAVVEKAMGYVQLCVSRTVMTQICQDLKELAVSIAEASGGFLGVTSAISKEEQAVLDKLNEIFDRSIELAQGEEGVEPTFFDF